MALVPTISYLRPMLTLLCLNHGSSRQITPGQYSSMGERFIGREKGKDKKEGGQWRRRRKERESRGGGRLPFIWTVTLTAYATGAGKGGQVDQGMYGDRCMAPFMVS